MSSRRAPSVLIVAGEPSGDRIAAGIARTLATWGVGPFGMGGGASEQAGVEMFGDFRGSSAMGLTEVLGGLPAVVTSFARIMHRVQRSPPTAAALVNYTEYNLQLAPRLRARGVPVLWCVAPQVWAWRRGRTPRVARAVDRMAVVLPFEAPIWRDAGVDVHYVGHPALDAAPLGREAARQHLGLPLSATAVGLLPGSRSHEVRRLAVPMLDAIRALSQRRTLAVRLILAGSLDIATKAWLRSAAETANVETFEASAADGAARYLSAFDATLAASGTATLESALAGAPPVIVYKLSAVTAFLAKRLVQTPHVGLPNILLGARHYPELLQGDAEPRPMADALARVLDERPKFVLLAEDLRQKLAAPGPHGPHDSRTTSERMANLLASWLPPTVAPDVSVGRHACFA